MRMYIRVATSLRAVRSVRRLVRYFEECTSAHPVLPVHALLKRHLPLPYGAPQYETPVLNTARYNAAYDMLLCSCCCTYVYRRLYVSATI